MTRLTKYTFNQSCSRDWTLSASVIRPTIINIGLHKYIHNVVYVDRSPPITQEFTSIYENPILALDYVVNLIPDHIVLELLSSPHSNPPLTPTPTPCDEEEDIGS